MRFHSHELKLQVDGDHRETSAGQARAVFFVEVLHQILVQIQSQPCLKRSKHTKICNAKARVKLPGGCQYTCSHQLMVWCGIMLRQGFPAIAEFQWRWRLTNFTDSFNCAVAHAGACIYQYQFFWFIWLFVTPSVSFHVWISMECHNARSQVYSWHRSLWMLPSTVRHMEALRKVRRFSHLVSASGLNRYVYEELHLY